MFAPRLPLDDESVSVRHAAISLLAALGPGALSLYASDFAKKATDDADRVALVALHGLMGDLDVTAAFADVIARRLEASCVYVRLTAMIALSKLPGSALSSYAAALAASLSFEGDQGTRVRFWALTVLSRIDHSILALYADQVCPLQCDASESVRRAAALLVDELFAPGGAGAAAAERDFRHAAGLEDDTRLCRAAAGLRVGDRPGLPGPRARVAARDGRRRRLEVDREAT